MDTPGTERSGESNLQHLKRNTTFSGHESGASMSVKFTEVCLAPTGCTMVFHKCLPMLLCPNFEKWKQSGAKNRRSAWPLLWSLRGYSSSRLSHLQLAYCNWWLHDSGCERLNDESEIVLSVEYAFVFNALLGCLNMHTTLATLLDALL